jgi:hypothetical protein
MQSLMTVVAEQGERLKSLVETVERQEAQRLNAESIHNSLQANMEQAIEQKLSAQETRHTQAAEAALAQQRVRDEEHRRQVLESIATMEQQNTAFAEERDRIQREALTTAALEAQGRDTMLRQQMEQSRLERQSEIDDLLARNSSNSRALFNEGFALMTQQMSQQIAGMIASAVVNSQIASQQNSHHAVAALVQPPSDICTDYPMSEASPLTAFTIGTDLTRNAQE